MVWLSVTIVIVSIGVQLFLRSFLVRNAKKIFWGVVGIVALFLVYVTSLQYSIWLNDVGVAQFLLPPYQGIGYFAFFALMRIWIPFIASLTLGLLFWWGANRYNAAHSGQFFELEEYALGAIALFVVGWPGVIIYAVLFLILFLVASLVTLFIKGKRYKLSTYYFWLPVSLFAILMNELIIEGMGIWNLLKF
jgi:hypothetical protein